MKKISEQLQLLQQLVAARDADVAPAAKVYACLVDAENTQHSKLAHVVEELSGFGEVVVRRIYGDFSRAQMQPWRGVSNELSFRPACQFGIVSGKGNADMALCMDAIELIHNDSLQIDGFALVSSDADFTPLASRLREAGKHVVGFGRRTTPTPFVNACHTFVYLENLGEEEPSIDATGAVTAVLQQSVAHAPPAAVPMTQVDTQKAVKELRLAISTLLQHPSARADGLLNIAALPDALRRRDPGWDVRSFGVSKKKGLIGVFALPEVAKHFTLVKTGPPDAPPVYLVRDDAEGGGEDG